MTLLDRKLGLILGLALFTFACEEPGEIGLNINPENGTFVARYFEIPIDNSINQHEDILSDNSTRIDPSNQNPRSSGRLLVGNYSTPEFGEFSSKAFVNFYLGQFGFNSEDFIFDSLKLHLKVDYLYGGSFLGAKRIYVHELSEELDLDRLYYTKDSTEYLPDPVGEINFDVSSFDSVYVDTVLSARLSDELGMRLFEKAETDTMAYNDNLRFREFFKGFAFVPDENNEMLAGVIAENRSTYMRIHFHSSSDTLSFDYVIPGYDYDTVYTNNDTLFSATNITRYYNNISLDKTGSPLAGIPGYYMDFETDDGLSYIQASSGIFTRLNFGKYFQFLDTANEMVINRAELLIPTAAYQDYLPPSPGLALYITDETNQLVEVEIDSLNSTFASVGVLNYSEASGENRGEYMGDLTNYIQGLTSSSTTDTLILLGQPGLHNSVLSTNQTIIDKENIILKVYYSSLN
jgi:hypothetical protein